MAGAVVQWLRDGLGIIDSAQDVAHQLAMSVPTMGCSWCRPSWASARPTGNRTRAGPCSASPGARARPTSPGQGLDRAGAGPGRLTAPGHVATAGAVTRRLPTPRPLNSSWRYRSGPRASRFAVPPVGRSRRSAGRSCFSRPRPWSRRLWPAAEPAPVSAASG